MNSCAALPLPMALPPVLTPAASSPLPSQRRGKGVFLLVFVVLTLGLVVFEVTGYFRLSREARGLRNTLLQATTSSADSVSHSLEFRVGPLTCLAVRSGLSHLHLDPTARAALDAVRGGEVGVYRLPRGGGSWPERGRLLTAADAAMSRRGWEPLVKVAERDQLVLIYVPANRGRGMTVQACVAVLQRDQLVIAAAKTNLEPLAKLGISELNLEHSAAGAPWSVLPKL